MPSEKTTINHVSDTAIWVAYYRMLESKRPDALFHDTLASLLVGERGREISDNMGETVRYTQWSVIIRTYVIDNFIQKLVAEGVDTVINLGAGLDTRPYRLELPQVLRWVEVDYPSVIEHKNTVLAPHKPRVNLERIPLDLADVAGRDKLFAKLGSESRNALIITEGVVPYLTEEQVASLAHSLCAQTSFRYWIAEYYSVEMYKHFQSRQHTERMQNAPFRFFPPDWLTFFSSSGWTTFEIKYLNEEAIKIRREIPVPWMAKVFSIFMSQERKKKFLQMLGYVVFTKTKDCPSA